MSSCEPSRRDFLKVAGASAAALSAGCIAVGRNSTAVQPNILVIVCDQLRHDVFSCQGNPVVQTPNIDRLAADGVSFQEATCYAPLCGPSRGALLTGQTAPNGGYMFTNAELMSTRPFWHGNAETVDETLHKNGYTVVYHGKWHVGHEHRECYQGGLDYYLKEYHDYLAERYEMPPEQGHKIDRYSRWPYRPWHVDDIMERAVQEQLCAMPHHNEAGVIDVADEDSLTAWTVQKTIDFLGNAPQAPFSVTCSILAPHAPLIATETYATMFDPADMPMPANLLDTRNYSLQSRNKYPAPIPDFLTPTVDGLAQFIALYYGLVKELDDQLGRLFEALDATGRAEDTLVIFTSDHGELMGSHATLSKGAFFDECLRVPLIMRYPRRIPAGLKLDTPTTGTDVAPTILDYAGLVSPNRYDGMSLRPAIEGQPFNREFAFSELGDRRCLRSKKWKYVVSMSGFEKLHDLENDPFELVNFLKDSSAVPEAVMAVRNDLRNRLLAMDVPGAIRG